MLRPLNGAHEEIRGRAGDSGGGAESCGEGVEVVMTRSQVVIGLSTAALGFFL